MKILSANQMQQADRFTIQNEPVASVNLMERAAQASVQNLLNSPLSRGPFFICCGPGNNGGDGLAIARLLSEKNLPVNVLLLAPGNSLSGDCKINRDRLLKYFPDRLIEIELLPSDFSIPEGGIIIDALFGTGLSKPLSAPFSDLVSHINSSGAIVISIDLPSGMYSDQSSISPDCTIVKASKTLTFQYLKQAMLVGENAYLFGEVEILDIGILPESLAGMDIRWEMTDIHMLKHFLKLRNPVSHKGTYGHSIILAGGKGKMGAAVLAAKAHVRSGAGLLTMLVPEASEVIIHCTVPDAMVETYDHSGEWLSDPLKWRDFSLGAGPGLGTSDASVKILQTLFNSASRPMVLDADALNILSANPSLLKLVPQSSILTPHPGEFSRLAGSWKNDFEKLDLQRTMASKWGLYILLKGYRSSIATPDGYLYFNPTGNPGLAKGGSGDVLTGLLTGLLSRGYSPLESLLLGTWLHGRAGDLAAIKFSMEGFCASDLPDILPDALLELNS